MVYFCFTIAPHRGWGQEGSCPNVKEELFAVQAEEGLQAIRRHIQAAMAQGTDVVTAAQGATAGVALDQKLPQDNLGLPPTS